MSSLKCATKNPNIQKCAMTSKKKKKKENFREKTRTKGIYMNDHVKTILKIKWI